jgi:hypothetical protein
MCIFYSCVLISLTTYLVYLLFWQVTCKRGVRHRDIASLISYDSMLCFPRLIVLVLSYR